MIEVITAGKSDVLVVWEISRKERGLEVFVTIRNLCMREGLNFWAVGANLYDLRDNNDRMNLGIQAVQAEYMADSIRDNVKRGIDLAAARLVDLVVGLLANQRLRLAVTNPPASIRRSAVWFARSYRVAAGDP